MELDSFQVSLHPKKHFTYCFTLTLRSKVVHYMSLLESLELSALISHH